jgi:phosphate starvation-inducible protein PhoH and related proteins
VSGAGETSELTRLIAMDDAAVAQAVFGPLHRHIAHIQEAFRDPRAPRGQPAYRVTFDLQGDTVIARAHEDGAAELERAQRIFDALIEIARRKGRVRESEVLAAISLSQGEGGETGPMHLPQLGGLVLRTPRQVHYVEALRDEARDLIFGVGPAGTGKTFLAVAAAVEALKQERFDRIIVTRPAVEAGEKLGYLPGDLAEKVDPYLAPIWDAFRSQMAETDLKARRERRQIEVAPLAFMRGRTLSNAFVIVDEAQNATILQMKMVLTRLGEGSRMVVTGDPSQVDLARSDMSGLAHAIALLEHIEGVEVIRFAAQDVVRHRLVARIVEAYHRDETKRG